MESQSLRDRGGNPAKKKKTRETINSVGRHRRASLAIIPLIYFEEITDGNYQDKITQTMQSFHDVCRLRHFFYIK